MTMPDNVVLHVADVHKSFAGLHALSDIDLSVKEGETHAIIGPNGAGKSTLLNVCIGRLKPDSGHVVFDGENLTGKQPHEINQLGVVRVFQTPEIFPELTILENAMVPIFAKRDGSFKLNWFGRFSGEKAVREKAEAILMLLLDEPTAGMARADTNATIDLLKTIKSRGMTKVIIEHDMHVVFSLADRITVLAGGRIISQGTPEEVKADPAVKEAYLGDEQV